MRKYLFVTAIAVAGVIQALELDIMKSGYPRVCFFRDSETQASNPRVSYEQWDATFNRLQGIIGKALDEEIPREARNPEIFSRFKKEYPNQLVMLHFNGNARDPNYEPEKFFAGHWIYEEAAMILSDIPAEDGETDIRVSSTKYFLTGVGRFKTSPTDIGLFCVKDGKHDWSTAEQVQLVSVDHENGIIRVKRGCFGTVPQAFPARKAHAAAHKAEGPWSPTGPMLWDYNFSTHCPKDERGRNCSDALVEDLAGKFLAGGKLELFDGVEFDVMNNFTHGDTDGDGIVDDAIFNGINTYALGMLEFCSKLRAALGEDRLILADGVSGTLQRAFGILNGMESEGWPHHPDNTILGWSGGLNRHLFWEREARKPVFNYINHRFTDRDAPEGPKKYRPDVPFSRHRLVLAASQFIDAAFCASYAPDPEPGEYSGVWDEMKKGTEWKLNWLGMPEGPAVHLATKTPGLLKNTAIPKPQIVNGKQTVQVELKVPANELFVVVRASCKPLTGYPESYPRLMQVKLSSEAFAADWRRNAVPMTWVNGKEFESTFYFRELSDQNVTLLIEVEGEEPVTISAVEAYAAPDTMVRSFEGGLVLANPSLHDAVFDLNEIAPGKKYRRLQASSKQDSAVNNGLPVTGKVTLSPLDGLFLVREESK